MRLWHFVIADGVIWHDATLETRALLDRITVDALLSKDIWTQFPILVRLEPNADIFPVRARYGDAEQATIGVNYLTSDRSHWFTLADCIASKLLTGKVPEIVEAIAFEAGPAQAGLQPIKISGNNEYAVDPSVDDFFKHIIELRQETKKRRGQPRLRGSTLRHGSRLSGILPSYGPSRWT
jgi:hypothetical protein